MPTITLILPYFGKLPKFFPLWLESCRTNESVIWLVLTDDRSPQNWPKNVCVSYCTFDEFRARIQSEFDFPISLERPYKLCDFKAAYGSIFTEELRNADFWGYCDCDLMFGNIRKFLTDRILQDYDRIFCNGHLTLIRNKPEFTQMYKLKLSGVVHYKDAFSSPRPFAFDEWGGTSLIWREIAPKRFYVPAIRPFDDLSVPEEKFVPRNGKPPEKNICYVWRAGTLMRVSDSGQEETMYVHFQKRPMRLPENPDFVSEAVRAGCVFVPGKCLPYDDRFLSDSSFRRKFCNPHGPYWHYWFLRLKNLKRKLIAGY